MGNFRKYVPSPAMIIALIALAVALGGTALAGTLTTPGTHADRAQDIALIKAQAARLRGPKGRTGTPGPRGPQGAPGAAGAPGSARSYGHVASDGKLDDARSKNVVSAAHVGAANSGDYCISPSQGINPATTSPIATIDHTGSSGVSPSAEIRSSNNGCAAGQFEVRTSNAAGDVDQPFFFLVP
jgi:hypothetical protein